MGIQAKRISLENGYTRKLYVFPMPEEGRQLIALPGAQWCQVVFSYEAKNTEYLCQKLYASMMNSSLIPPEHALSAAKQMVEFLTGGRQG